MNPIDSLKKQIERRAERACKKAAKLAAKEAERAFAAVEYTGNKDTIVAVEDIEHGAKVTATGESVLFLEYGAGITYGYGHPDVGRYGPGTWPGKHYSKGADGKLIANWENPKGWRTPQGEHTYGNAPSAGMFKAFQKAEQEILRIAEDLLDV